MRFNSPSATERAFALSGDISAAFMETCTLVRQIMERKPSDNPFPRYMVGRITLSGTAGDVQEINPRDNGGVDPFQNDSYPFVLESLYVINLSKPADYENALNFGISITDRSTGYELFGARKTQGRDQTLRSGFIPYKAMIDTRRYARPIMYLPGGYKLSNDGGFRVMVESQTDADQIEVVMKGYWELP